MRKRAVSLVDEERMVGSFAMTPEDNLGVWEADRSGVGLLGS